MRVLAILLLLLPVAAEARPPATYKQNCFTAMYLNIADAESGERRPQLELVPYQGTCIIDYDQVMGTRGNELYFIRYKNFVSASSDLPEDYNNYYGRMTGAIALFKKDGELIYADNEFGSRLYYLDISKTAANTYGEFLLITRMHVPEQPPEYASALQEMRREYVLYKLEGSQAIPVDTSIFDVANLGIELPEDVVVIKGEAIDFKKMKQRLAIWQRGEPNYGTLEVKYKYLNGKIEVDSYTYDLNKKF